MLLSHATCPTQEASRILDAGFQSLTAPCLKVLADAPRGVSEEVLVVAHGFSAEMLAGLVLDGLATVVTETKKGRNEDKKDQGRARPRGPTTEVKRIRITDAGRKALSKPK